MGAAIEAVDLRKVYAGSRSGTPALDGLSLSVPTGGVYGVIGRNGAGKTTFVRVAATQLSLSSGRLTVLGHDATREERAIRARIACVPQESRPLYFLTVEEVVYYYLKMRGLSSADARKRTAEGLEELSLLEHRRRLVSHLSGGLRRRTLCAMVLSSDADILFLDEPTTGLDPIARREVWGAIRRASREQRTILLTTHYLDEAEALSSRLVLIERGQKMLEGVPADLRARVRYPYRVTIQDTVSAEELEPYGKVSTFEGGSLVFARENEARELARWALERGLKVSMGPVSLEDIFLDVVGRAIDQDAPLENGEEAA
jgi:ABC-2 type transport system ATP-binding protein